MINQIFFDIGPTKKHDSNASLNPQILFLLDKLFNFDIFALMPRHFSISTNSGLGKFNIEIIKETSSVISKQIEENPQNLEYHLDIDDPKNVLEKFEQIYQGKSIVFNEDEFSIANQIAKSLNISNFPESINEKSNTIAINQNKFKNFVKNERLKTFTIKTNKKEYKCNIFGILSSGIIREFLKEEPFKNEYLYDFEDECDEFQLICNIFNFEKVEITVQNKDFLKEIAEELQIEIILKRIDRYIKNCENFYEKIDMQQDCIDSINQLFDLLYHIKEKTVSSVKMSIIQSFWCQTKENVLELAAFILQAVNTDFLLHQYLADLLVELDKESNEDNELNSLVPHIIKMLKFSFNETTFNCSFIYNLHKKGFITKSEIINLVKEFFDKIEKGKYINYISNDDENSCYNIFLHNSLYNLDSFDSFDSDILGNNNICNLYMWFLPELIEIDKFDKMEIVLMPESFKSFIYSFYPDKIEAYKKMRDKGEPDDEITLALRNDDVDTLQSYISKLNDPKLIVPFNIYENFVPIGEIDFLNYSAAYGSIKCFKYLLLNHLKCDESTFNFAVYGGNIEIIKIANYQKDLRFQIIDYNSQHQERILKNISNHAKHNNYFFSINSAFKDRHFEIYKIISSITKHQDYLFDWILEQKFPDKKNNDILIKLLIIYSAYSGNVHSFFRILNNDRYISRELKNYAFQITCRNGFYRFAKIIFKTMKKEYDYDMFDPSSSVYFGNLSIFKFSFNLELNQRQLEKAFIAAVLFDRRNIIDYYFDKLAKMNFKFGKHCIYDSINASVMRESSELFFYLIDNFNRVNDSKINFLEMDSNIIENACLFGNFKAATIILDSYFSSEKNKTIDSINFDFNKIFFKAAYSGSLELCQYLIESKVSIDFVYLSSKYEELSTINEAIFSLILKNCNCIAKKQFLSFHLIPAIENRNYGVVELLLKEKAIHENALFKAIENHDLKMVKLILKYNKEPSFINRSCDDGTALCVAVRCSEVEIIKMLLSIPGINPDLCNDDGKTPLMLACSDLELMEPFLNFYGDNIIYQTRQIRYVMKSVFGLLFIDVMDNEDMMPLIERLLKIKGLNINDLFSQCCFLSCACEKNNIELVRMLLNLDNIDVNIQIPVMLDTPLNIAIKNNCVEIAELLINDPRTDINRKNLNGETAFSLAFFSGHERIFELLLNNDKLDFNNNNIDTIFMKASNNYRIKFLSSEKIDVNHLLLTHRDNIFYLNSESYSSSYSSSYHSSDSDLVDTTSNNNNNNTDIQINNDNNNEVNTKSDENVEKYDDDILDDFENKITESILYFSVRTNNIEIIDFVIQHRSFDKEKSDLESSIFRAINDGKLFIFRKLLKLLNNEVNEYKMYKKTLFYYAVRKGKIKMTKEILDHPNFDYKKNKPFDVFCANLLTLKKNSYEMMKYLYDYDRNHGSLLNLNDITTSGETVFTSINKDWVSQKSHFINIDEIINFLIEKGADPNIQNKKGVYPLQHAIDSQSLNFVLSLIKSNKIDFSKRIKSLNNSTFLHLAAVIKNASIFKELLDRNVIDINSTDDLSETPLMYAVRFNKFEQIKLLFDRDDLDYLHCNNENFNALRISQTYSLSRKESQTITDKKNYYDNLYKHREFTDNIYFTVYPLPEPNLYPNIISSRKTSEDNDIFKFKDNSSSFGEFFDKDSSCSTIIAGKHHYKKLASSNTTNLYSTSTSIIYSDYQSTELTKTSTSLDNEQIDKNTNDLPNILSHQNKPSTIENHSYELSTSNSDNDKNDNELIKDNKNQNNDPNKLPSIQSHQNKRSINKDTLNELPNNENNKIQMNNLSNLPSLQKKTSQIKQDQTNQQIKKHDDEITKNSLNQITPRSIFISDSNSKESDQRKVTISNKTCLPQIDVSSSPRSKLNRVRILQRKSDNGDAEAQYSLGVCYSHGEGVSIDKEKALQYYLMSAEQGYRSALYSAASCYSYGIGTEINKEKAFEFYLRAAEKGFDKAQFAVGHFYEFGQGGVEKSHEKAVEWYQKAAKQGHKGSIQALNFK